MCPAPVCIASLPNFRQSKQSITAIEPALKLFLIYSPCKELSDIDGVVLYVAELQGCGFGFGVGVGGVACFLVESESVFQI